MFPMIQPMFPGNCFKGLMRVLRWNGGGRQRPLSYTTKATGRSPYSAHIQAQEDKLHPAGCFFFPPRMNQVSGRRVCMALAHDSALSLLYTTYIRRKEKQKQKHKKKRRNEGGREKKQSLCMRVVHIDRCIWWASHTPQQVKRFTEEEKRRKKEYTMMMKMGWLEREGQATG